MPAPDLKALLLGAAPGVTSVNVPELKATFYIRELALSEIFAWFAELPEDGKWQAGEQAKLLARALSDKDGNRLFTDAEWEAIAKKGHKVLRLLFTEAMRFNSLSDTPEALKKN